MSTYGAKQSYSGMPETTTTTIKELNTHTKLVDNLATSEGKPSITTLIKNNVEINITTSSHQHKRTINKKFDNDGGDGDDDNDGKANVDLYSVANTPLMCHRFPYSALISRSQSPAYTATLGCRFSVALTRSG